MEFSRELRKFIEQLDNEPVDAERAKLLGSLTAYIKKQRAKRKVTRLHFICTHNSRRSQFGQAWSYVLGLYLGLDLEVYSGGVEVTSFNPAAVNALRSAGVQLSCRFPDVDNPVYELHLDLSKPAINMYSKLYHAGDNPKREFLAVMTCAEADENCPHIPGADQRISLTYADPKAFDGTHQMDEQYYRTSKQIAVELFYSMKRAL